VEGGFLFLQFFLGTVGILDGNVLQLGLQIAPEGGHVLLTELGTLGLFFFGQFPLLCQTGQFVDAIDLFLFHKIPRF
jgi:hypothetical protein